MFDQIDDLQMWGATTVSATRSSRFPRWKDVVELWMGGRAAIARDPELLAFSGLKLAWLAVAYTLWAYGYSIIPWIHLGLIDAIWDTLWVLIASMPLGVLTIAMCASVLARHEGRDSTFLGCTWVAVRRSFPAAIFQAIDGYITVRRQSSRAGEEDYRPSRSLDGVWLDVVPSAAWEVLFQGWKAATVGVLPGIASGFGIARSMTLSLRLLRDRPAEVLALRAAYSLFGWCLAVPGILGAGLWLGSALDDEFALEFLNAELLFKAGVPLMLVLGVYLIVVRPFYLVATTSLWASWASENPGVLEKDGWD